MKQTRMFIGAVPSSKSNNRLVAALEDYREAYEPSGLRWIPAENWHMTLRFLGNSDPEQISAWTDRLPDCLPNEALPPLNCPQLAPFPNPHRPSVLAFLFEPAQAWLGVAECLESLATSLGYKAECNNYRPHLSVARTKRGQQSKISVMPIDMRIEVERIVLFESHLSDKGARYKPLLTLPLETA